MKKVLIIAFGLFLSLPMFAQVSKINETPSLKLHNGNNVTTYILYQGDTLYNVMMKTDNAYEGVKAMNLGFGKVEALKNLKDMLSAVEGKEKIKYTDPLTKEEFLIFPFAMKCSAISWKYQAGTFYINNKDLKKMISWVKEN